MLFFLFTVKDINSRQLLPADVNEQLTESFDKTVPVKPRPLRRFPSSEDDVKALNPHRQRLVRLDLHGARTPFYCAACKTQEKRSGMTDIQSGLNKLHGATLNVCNLTH